MDQRISKQKREQLGNLNLGMKYVKKFDVALDAGANIGTWTAVMADAFSHVISFEPALDVFKNLEDVAEAFHNVEAYNKALGSEHGEVSVLNTLKKQHNSFSRFVRPVKYKNEVFVNKAPMVTIDSLNLDNLDLLKIDVEGLEVPVLKGGEQVIKRFKPVIIIESSSYGQRRYGETADAMEQLLAEWGATEVEFRNPDKVFIFKESTNL